ncbi:MAG: hypothetical protein NTW97_05845 [Candidatus Krumholzibacteria bacterium]|nr:hypothetical protein [Candidatus Krumholzibacteria bacterium]
MFRRSYFLRAASYSIVVAAVMAMRGPAHAQERGQNLKGKFDAVSRSIVLDGSAVTSAGNLQMNVTNFGFLGSLPKSSYPMADSPSAQWPAGSGVEYLYAAGLWIGAEVDGVPSVSTSYPEMEFYPTDSPVDIIYKTSEGSKGGRNYPANPDDDGDGRINEDWLNGRDDDRDGLIDEDFAAIGKLMYSCWFTDDQPVARRVWPNHAPLNIKVRQETYQWSEESSYNSVGVHYDIGNEGGRFLQNVYFGIYADLDAGPRNYPTYFKDDLIGSWSGTWCAPIGGGVEMPERISTLYVYDNDGDGGKTQGYFGVVLLGTQMVMSDGTAERLQESPAAIRIFAGLLPYERGGEPINDFQRYELLSRSVFQPNTDQPNDYKALMSVGPFFLGPGQSIALDIAYTAGKGLDEFLDNAAYMKLIYNGTWVDKDKNRNTGVNGRESIFIGDEGSAKDGIYPDPCNSQEKVKVAVRDTIWINADCFEETELWNYPDCFKGSMYFRDFQTGINGRESRINWITSETPPPPNMRAVVGDGVVGLIWDNLSEITPDPITLKKDFEGYQVWRADEWHRPSGTTIASGPSDDLWHLLDSRDLMNDVEPNIDLEKPWADGGFQYEPLQQVEGKALLLKAFEENLYYDPFGKVPCPPGVTEAECDTLEALARWNLGYDGGRQYYRYVDHDVKNGIPYFYSVIAYEPLYSNGKPKGMGRADTPYANFVYAMPRSEAQEAEDFAEKAVYVVPNPVTREAMAPWTFQPNNADPSGEKAEFRNLPKCPNTVRIFTVAGDLVQILRHNGSAGNGTLAWNLVSRNGQTVTSGVYLFSVEPDDGRFPRFVGKFVVIR